MSSANRHVGFSIATKQSSVSSSSSTTFEHKLFAVSPTINQTLTKLNKIGNIKIGIVKSKKPAAVPDKVLQCLQKLPHISVKKTTVVKPDPEPAALPSANDNLVQIPKTEPLMVALKCGHCSHVFADYDDLQIHVQTMHVSEEYLETSLDDNTTKDTIQYDDNEFPIEYVDYDDTDSTLHDHTYQTLTESAVPAPNNESLATNTASAALLLDGKNSPESDTSDDCSRASCKICRPICETAEEQCDWQLAESSSEQRPEPVMSHNKQPCNICPMEFVSDLALNTHYLCDHEDMIEEQIKNACLMCFALFPNANKRMHHEQTTHYKRETDQYVCIRCAYANQSFEMVAEHLATNHKPWKCHHCGTSVRSYDRWLVHVIRHATAELLSLPNDDIVPAETGKLLRLRECRCEICGKTFIGRKKLQQHEKSVHLDATRNIWRCPLCAFASSNRYVLRDHTIEHAGVAPFVCDICGKGVNTKRMLKTHLMRHNRDFKCVICGKSFEVRNKLLRHEKYHTDVRPFKCHLCDKAYKDLTDLRRHKWSHGIGAANISCTKCDKMFYEQKQLRHHMRMHAVSE